MTPYSGAPAPPPSHLLRAPAGLLLILAASVLWTPVLAQTVPTRRIELPEKSYSMHREEVREGEERITLNFGVFAFAPFIVVDTGADRRMIFEVGARFRPGPARHEPAVRKGGFLNMQKIPYARPFGSTALDVESVEIREGGKTIALLVPGEGGRAERLTGKRTSFTVTAGVPTTRWQDIEVLFHVHARVDDARASEIPRLKSRGLGTFVWKPGATEGALRSRIPPGTPPKPANLKVEGAGLTVHPESPFVGDTFATVILLQNTGELDFDTADYEWSYADATLRGVLPALAGGARARLEWAAAGAADEREIRLRITPRPGVFRTSPPRDFRAEIEPLKRPRLNLHSAALLSRISDDPLELLLMISNTGSGPAEAASVRLSHEGGDTLVQLPPLPVKGPVPIQITWPDSFPLDFELTVHLSDESDRESTLVIPVHRRPRPKPRFVLDGMEFVGERQEGMPGRFLARIRNAGDLAGEASFLLDVTAPDRDTRIISRRLRFDIGAGRSTEFTTDVFPFEQGLLRGTVLGHGIEDFSRIDVPPWIPPTANGSENAVFLHSIDETATPRITRVARPLVFRFAPLADVTEFDSSVTLIIASRTWPSSSGAASPRDESARPSLRVQVEGSGVSDRFDIASTESVASYPLPKQSLLDTLTFRVELVGYAPTWLIGSPLLRVAPAATEHGRITRLQVRDSGIYARVENAAAWFDAFQVTLAAAYGNSDDSTFVVRLKKGEARNVFIPMKPPRPGRHALRLSMPFSAVPDPRLLEQFVAPRPMPRIRLESISATKTAGGETGLLALVSVRDNDAPDLEATGSGSDTFRLPTVPASETAVFYFPSANQFHLLYGFTEIQSVNVAGDPPSPPYVRIIDFGGSLPTKQAGVIRFVRVAGAEGLPAGKIFFEVNGILRGAVSVPEQAPRERYFGGIRFTPAQRDPIRVSVFETLLQNQRKNTMIDRSSTEIAELSDQPTRADWDWLGPVRWSPDTPPARNPSLYLRLGELAMRATEFLVPWQLAPVSPQPARDMEALRNDTTALGRVAYRDQLALLVAQWRSAYVTLSNVRLPVTVDAAHVSDFIQSLERLQALADDPGILDKTKVERELERLERRIELVLGLQIDEKYRR